MDNLSFDRFSRSRKDLLAHFEFFGELECPQVDGRIYRELCRVVGNDESLLAMAAVAPASQPPPNLLFAAVHYLLLSGEGHSLRQWYPSLARGEPNSPDSIGASFKEFCTIHRDRIEALMRTRRTQTNEVQRAACLLPAFGRVFEEGGKLPLSLVDVGCSGGLNLKWDRFFYRYDGGPSWGDSNSAVVLECELRGSERLPELAETIPVTWRRGMDLHPVDVEDMDEVLWLRSLVWPDHVGRQERLTAAIEIFRKDPPLLVEGDASAQLPMLLAEAPVETTLCVYATHALYQFPREALIAMLKGMQSASRYRPVHFLSIEGTVGDGCSELRWTVYENGDRWERLMARCNPHGRWLEWLL